jgi:hypothetical protein
MTGSRLAANQVHSTLTWATDRGNRFGWHCQDCPATAEGYTSENHARRIASIHEDPSRTTQGRTSAATKN